MDAKEKIILFMKWKNKKLSSLGIPYFTKQDEKSINKWAYYTCFKVWNEMNDLSKIPRWGIDDSSMCPFCCYKTVKHIQCNTCKYAKNHGDCHDEKNATYSQILIKIFENDITIASICEYVGKVKISRKIKRLNKT